LLAAFSGTFSANLFLTSQGSAATYVRYGGTYYSFVANFIRFPISLKENVEDQLTFDKVIAS